MLMSKVSNITSITIIEFLRFHVFDLLTYFLVALVVPPSSMLFALLFSLHLGVLSGNPMFNELRTIPLGNMCRYVYCKWPSIT